MAGLCDSKRWQVLPYDETLVHEIVRACEISPLVARILVSRGIKTPEQADEFLHPDLERDWQDPHKIPGMDNVCECVFSAIKAHKCIAVLGDFDVDGMSATALLVRALKRFGARVHAFIPDRFDEGYGLSDAALSRVIDGCSPDLILTVDTGISAAKEVEKLSAQGIEIAITDHHEPAQATLPHIDTLTDPRLDPSSVSQELAGVGVALKLVCLLGEKLGEPDAWKDYLEIATLGTISDMMLLDTENRALVAAGIEQMHHTKLVGLSQLAAVSRQDITKIAADDLPFSLVPRLNAAGRMGKTDIALRLLLTDDLDEAVELAAQLEQVNTERREIEQDLTQQAFAEIEKTYHGESCIVIAGEGWHEGVKGIVASRIVNTYHVPAILMTISDGVAKGSGRSVGSVNLYDAVAQCSDYLDHFGGHPQAIGVTVAQENIAAFREQLIRVLDKLPKEQFIDKDNVELASLDELACVEEVASLDALRPFGRGNARPIFAMQNVLLQNRSRVGAAQDHFRCLVTDGAHTLSSIMFRAPDIEKACEYEGIVDVVGQVNIETWQGKTSCKLMLKDILYHDDIPEDEIADEHIEALFDASQEVLNRDSLIHLVDKQSFMTKIVGVSFDQRQSCISELCEGDLLSVVREKDNAYDPHALALYDKQKRHLGYIRKEIAAVLSPVIDAKDLSYQARVASVSEKDDTHTLQGVNICVERIEQQAVSVASKTRRARFSALDMDKITNVLRRDFIGNAEFLPCQKQALQNLAENISTLCVMATGRGKSLIFHIHAARIALLEHKTSIFVFPLRALVSDQAFHMSQTFAQFGLNLVTITGETPEEERKLYAKALAQGDIDIVLTTPEFLSLHTDMFTPADTGFVVIDEAHHACETKGGGRPAYNEFPRILQQLENPCVLALSATLSEQDAQKIKELCALDAVLIDKTRRENLHIVDRRGVRLKDAAIVTSVAQNKKTIIYTNSREQTVTLAKMLRAKLPYMATKIAFYNGSMTRTERMNVEDAFRQNRISCICATSAFGEGVNFPDVRQVILYHVPFDETEFNQMAGRAGRDGKDAEVHLLFSDKDAHINERIIASNAPERDELVAIYKVLKTHAKDSSFDEGITLTNDSLAQAAQNMAYRSHIDASMISCALAIFKELGFIQTSGFGKQRKIHVYDTPQKMDLSCSSRYLEGKNLAKTFQEFRNWILQATAEQLLDHVAQPIVPAQGIVIDGDDIWAE